MQSVERVAFLLFVAAIVSMLARRIRLPYTVGLVVTGIGLALLPGQSSLHLTRNLIFFAFLPPLIFEASHQLKWSELRRELPVSATLATVGVILSVAVVASGCCFILNWTWPASILVGVLISATDPVAVIAIFRDHGIKGRLQMRVESESLFNDGTAAVLFSVALGAASGEAVSAASVLTGFITMTVGGVLCGAVVAGLALLLAGRTKDHLVEITFTTIAAYASFLIAEHFNLSGVLATMTAGIILGNLGSQGPVSERGHEMVEAFWEYLGFVANSLIFLLIGISLAYQRLESAWMAILVVVGLMLAGRALAVYPCCWAFRWSAHRVALPDQHLLFWGGLRGALALALVLGLPDDFSAKPVIVPVVFAAVAFSILAQGLTIGPLMSRLRIGRG